VSQLPAGYDPATFNAVLTWTEYLNRLLGVTIGILITATCVTAIAWHRNRPRILWPSIAALLLVAFEGWLGGQVVRSGLEPWMISAHLIFALIIVTLLLYATFVAFRLREGDDRPASPERRRLRWIAVGVIALVLVQVYLGTLVRGGLEQAVQSRPDLARSDWLAAIPMQDQAHRGFAFVTGLAVVSLMFQVRTRFRSDQRLGMWASLAATLLGIQIVVGLILGQMDLPPAAQVAHLSVASLLLGSLVVVALLAGRER
jgi:cytochrome c oxidase assembly protein subunit 15